MGSQSKYIHIVLHLYADSVLWNIKLTHISIVIYVNAKLNRNRNGERDNILTQTEKTPAKKQKKKKKKAEKEKNDDDNDNWKKMSKWIMSIGCRRVCACVRVCMFVHSRSMAVYGSASGSNTAIGIINIHYLTCVVINFTEWKRKLWQICVQCFACSWFSLVRWYRAIPIYCLCIMEMAFITIKCKCVYSRPLSLSINLSNLQITFTYVITFAPLYAYKTHSIQFDWLCPQCVCIWRFFT